MASLQGGALRLSARGREPTSGGARRHRGRGQRVGWRARGAPGRRRQEQAAAAGAWAGGSSGFIGAGQEETWAGMLMRHQRVSKEWPEEGRAGSELLGL